MTKEEIIKKLEQLKKTIDVLNNEIAIGKRAEDDVSDLTLEESQLELELAKIEEQEELLPTKPWSHADDEVDNDR